jgi:hypothetical protein
MVTVCQANWKSRSDPKFYLDVWAVAAGIATTGSYVFVSSLIYSSADQSAALPGLLKAIVADAGYGSHELRQ